MKETSSLRDRVIDRNWVLKRKRKRVSCRSLLYKKEDTAESSESPRNSHSVRRKQKDDNCISRFSHKIKGHDGYYFECVECDLGGNLLCCDSCPRTYHLDCLNPPLKRTPPGKWQCPYCSGQKDLPKSSSNTDARQAKIKITFGKSKISNSSPGSDKPSVTGTSSIRPKYKSDNKRKASSLENASEEKQSPSSQARTCCSTKSLHSYDDGSMDAALEDNKTKKNPSAGDRKKGCSKEIFVKTLDLSDISLTTKPEVSKYEMQGKKPILLSAESSQKSKKKKHKAKRADNKMKKTVAEKEEHIAKSFHNPKSSGTASGLGRSLSHKKRKLTGQQICAFTAEVELKEKKHTIQKQPERSPEGVTSSSHGLNERLTVDKTTRCHENFLDGTQQVDRILGCRVKSKSATSSSHSQPMKSVPSSSLAESGSKLGRLTQNQDKPMEGDVVDAGAIDLKEVKCVHGEEHHSHINLVEVVKGKTDAKMIVAEDSVKTPQIIEAGAGGCTDQFLEAGKCEILEPSVNVVGTGESMEGFSEVDASGKLVTADIRQDGHILEPSSVSECCDYKSVKQTRLESHPDNSADNRVVSSTVQDSSAKGNDNILYEFLVKWMGRSNIHNSWVSESHLKILAKRKLENYKAKYGTAIINICEEQWSVPQRVIALRNSKDGVEEALIKWHGLPYDECTWEGMGEPVLKKFAHLVDEFRQLESLTRDKDSRDRSFGANVDGCDVLPLLEQPKELRGGSLFPHQLEALNWLRKCWLKSKNVILADEMGLGKTVSASAFISSLYFEFHAKLPCLVLVPLSTMPNWMAEFALWTPHLNVVEYHGGAKARSIIRQYEWHACRPDGLSMTKSYKFNVLLTTYEMVLADSSHLRGIPWEVLIVDEGHRLKNSESKLFSLLNTFSFQHRVLLTGTPLQNNIGEMYNLLNFLQPASFPSLSAFEEKFKNLTTAEKVEELKKLVAPHMLRRLKKDAMQNIPPKTERIVPVELSSIQAEYYRAMLTKNYQILRNTGKGGAHQSLLNIVMQLRKVCNHPYLIPGTEPESGSMEFLQEMRIKASGKLTLLHSMLKVLNKEGHRVLIFSQMTKLLDILEDYLTIEFGPRTFERVDGSVSVADRQAAITRFNQDRSRFVFLLSTRSCGLGINLATADTVIIYDSDFNPHADIQAMNRAHRIGQSNRLLVYRLVVRASVEERILHLAKKKLMLDQLFVNKSESQKEVEDILQWGTEELFSECEDVSAKDSKEGSNCIPEAVADGDFKHRRRSGGLGDVYKDRCTEVSSKIVWDESAIMKLLDRSNLQSAVSESPDGDLENDMLGSVKSLEWNDEPNEETGGAELLNGIAGDGSDQVFEPKEDNVTIATEENEWDRLLRVRWEKYQIEEEATLGRGKRLRKAISYKETFAQIPSEALSESDNEDEEPEREYTPAGRALKAKFARLRARQKERLAQRRNMDAERSELSTQLPTCASKEMESLGISKAVEDTREQTSSINLENANLTGPVEVKTKSDSIPRPGRFSKHGYKRFHSSNLDLSVRTPGTPSPDVFITSHQFQNINYAHLPVLGLCAPNASQVDSTSRNVQSSSRLPLLNHEQSRASNGIPDFPLPPPAGAGPASDLNYDKETNADISPLPSTSTDAMHQRLKNIIPDGYFPFSQRQPSSSKRRGPVDLIDPSGSSFSAFQEKMSLPNLVLDDKMPSKFPLPSKDATKAPHLDLLPNLSLGTHSENFNSIEDLPNVPLVPDFRQHLSEALKQKHQMPELPPIFGLGQIKATHSSLPENHKKVLDNIMMRTGSSRSKFLKRKLKVDAWTEDELDALWIGVRRYGRGNWEAMLRDPKLKFSKQRTLEDLSMRWAEEQLKIFDGPAFVAPKPSKPPTFPGISDGMMTRALLGSKFARPGVDPPKLRSHLTDIQLGCGDLMPPFPLMNPSVSALHEGFPPLPTWHLDKLRPIFPRDFAAGPSERAGSLNLPLDLPVQNNSLPVNIGSVNMDCSTTRDLRENDDELYANYNNLPNLLDRPLNLLHDPQNIFQSCEPSSRLPFDPKQKWKASSSSTVNETAAGISKVDKLPHWLREAVNLPSSKLPEPELPPTVSAIAQSVRLLYGKERPTIPPFTIPGPPPLQPKDPRKILKKKRKLHKLRQAAPEIADSIGNYDPAASRIVPPAPPLPADASSIPLVDPNLSPTTLNLNLNALSVPTLVSPGKKPGPSLSPSTEVLNLVASCMTTGPSMSILPDMPITSCQNIEAPVQKDLEISEQGGKKTTGDLEDIHGKRKASRKSPLGDWGKLTETDQVNQTESGDSSKTRSNNSQAELLKAEETLSEETLSDGHQSEHEL